MPLLSAFTPLGMLAMSSKPSHAETIYRSMIASLGGNYAVTEGSREDAKLYADAMMLARQRYLLEHAGREADPRKVTENIGHREYEFGLVPGPQDSLATRRAALTSRKLLPNGASKTNVENALGDLLGDDFVAYYPVPYDAAGVSPATFGASPMNLQLPEVPRRVIRTIDSVSVLGSVTVRYEAHDNDTATELDGASTVDAVRILVGDVLVIDPETLGLTERVTVTAVGLSAGPPAYRSFTAVFAKAHSAGRARTTQPFPYQLSYKRHNVVILTAEAAADPVRKQKADELLARILRGVSTWSVAAESTAGDSGPFILNESLLNITTIGLVSP